MIRLVIRDSEGGEASFPVTKPVTIGRSHVCDVRFMDDSISRKHARVFLDYGDAVIEDLSTPNGTMVNNVKIVGKLRLQAGDIIQIANEKIRVIETSPLNDVCATTNVTINALDPLKDADEAKGPWNEPIEPRANAEKPLKNDDRPETGAASEKSGVARIKYSSGRVVWGLAAAAIVLLAIIILLVERS